MPPAAFKPVIPASERLQTHVLDRAVTGNGTLHLGYPHSQCRIPAFGPILIYSDRTANFMFYPFKDLFILNNTGCMWTCKYNYIYRYL